MGSFDQNALDDFVYDTLAANTGITDIVDSVNSIIAVTTPTGSDNLPIYPLIRYQVFSKFECDYVIGNGKATYRGSYQIVAITKDDPRTAKDLAKFIQDSVDARPYQAISSDQTVVVFRLNQTHPGDSKNDSGDDTNYTIAGAVYELEVTA